MMISGVGKSLGVNPASSPESCRFPTMQLIATTTSLLVLASCARAPLGMLGESEGTTPARLPNATSMPRVAQAPSADPAGSLSLAEAYQLALTRSERVAITTQQVESERLARRSTHDGLLPTAAIGVSSIFRRERISVNRNMMGQETRTVIQTAQQNAVEGKVTQPLFRRGVFSSLEAADRGIEAAREAIIREQETLARDVASAFIGVLRTRKLIELAKVATQRAKEQLDQATARAKSGNALKNPELQARVDLKRAAQQTVTAKRDAIVADALFTRLVGVAPPAQLVMPAEPSLPALDGALAQVRKRADVRSLERRVDQARVYEESANAARWWPRADVVGTVQYLYPKQFDRSFEWSVLGTLTIPLFEADQHTLVATRSNETRLAALEVEAQLRLVDEEVVAAAAQVTGSQEVEKLAVEQLEAARELYKLVDKQFKLGAVTYLEITNASAVLVEAENTFEVSRIDRIASIYDYLYVIGTLDLAAAK